MQNFVSFIKENYSYFVYAIEFILAIVSAVVAFVQNLRCKKARNAYRLLNDANDITLSYNHLYRCLPEWIEYANSLYPIHGDGEKRFQYVYRKALDLLGRQPSESFRFLISELIDDILNADKVDKIFRDTQDFEPKKEFYEKKEVETIEGSQDLCQDGKENQSAERSARYVPRRD